MYDIIGDVHGHAPLLKKLLIKLGYEKKESVFFHPERKAVFIGDFINRGPEIRKTLRIIRSMVEAGYAYAILGNHEINAIIYHLKDKTGSPLIKQPGKFFLSLFKTVNEFAGYSDEWSDNLKWLRTLPVSLDFGEIRVVHACWDKEAIDRIHANRIDGRFRKKLFRKVQNKPNGQISLDFWRVTKGMNMKIPSDIRIINNKGVWTRSFRLKWWEDPQGKTFNEMSYENKVSFPSYTIPEQILPKTIPYHENEPIVFFGHYCQNKGPLIIKSNLCCVDSCVTGSGVLTCYRWNGEKELIPENLIQVKK